jgi:hypothetical protein
VLLWILLYTYGFLKGRECLEQLSNWKYSKKHPASCCQFRWTKRHSSFFSEYSWAENEYLPRTLHCFYLFTVFVPLLLLQMLFVNYSSFSFDKLGHQACSHSRINLKTTNLKTELVGFLWRGISPVGSPPPIQDNTNTEERHLSIHREGFEPMNPVFVQPNHMR